MLAFYLSIPMLTLKIFSWSGQYYLTWTFPSWCSSTQSIWEVLAFTILLLIIMFFFLAVFLLDILILSFMLWISELRCSCKFSMCPVSRINEPSILLAHSWILRKWFIISIIYSFFFVNAVTGLKEMKKHTWMELQGTVLNLENHPHLHQMKQR